MRTPRIALIYRLIFNCLELFYLKTKDNKFHNPKNMMSTIDKDFDFNHSYKLTRWPTAVYDD